MQHNRLSKNRRFFNMKKMCNIQTGLSKNKNSELYKLFKTIKTDNSCIHNLVPNLKIPFLITAVLSLGLKFSFPMKPNFKLIREHIEEAIRKLCWSAHFSDSEQKLSKIDLTLIKIKKDIRKNTAKFHSKLEDELFPEKHKLIEDLVIDLKKITHTTDSMYGHLIHEFQLYQQQNNIIIIQADKNAGVCLIRRADYQTEVMRQLEDLNTYHPSTEYMYNSKMDYLRDEIRMYSANFPTELKLKSLIPFSHRAASFYVLPKVHKPYQGIPKGRPISSTINTLNRGISRLLDSILQPIMNFVPDMVLDSAHLLLLLHDLKLNPNKKYMLVTADIDALYTNLSIKNCKKFTCLFYEQFKHLINMPFEIKTSEIMRMLNWSLDYSFVEFESEYFYQHRGIQMGNNASVAIANITVYQELVNMYKRCVGLVFRARFIDDILMIVEVKDTTNVEDWFQETFVHEYLTFTHVHSFESIDFLDLTISLDKNNAIRTALYKKPINKHQFLHYNSAHPKHLLNSLPYSSSLRIIRSCTDMTTRNLELDLLMEKFRKRNYPESVLSQCLEKVKNFSQISILTPKKELVISNLRIHNPAILAKYNVSMPVSTCVFKNRTFIVIPFYKNILGMGKTVKYFFTKHCTTPKFSRFIDNIHVSIAYKQPNKLQRYIKN